MNLFFVVFRSFVLMPNLMCKLIHNRCKLTCKLITKTTAACVYENEQSVLAVILCFTSENYAKTIIRLRLGPVNVGKYSPRLRLGEYSPMFTER